MGEPETLTAPSSVASPESAPTAEATNSTPASQEKHHFWDNWPVIGKHEATSVEGPKAGDSTPIPSGLEQAAANAPESKDVVASAGVDTSSETGSVDTGVSPDGTGSVPAAINTETPTTLTDTVGAPTPLAMPPETPASTPAAPQAEMTKP